MFVPENWGSLTASFCPQVQQDLLDPLHHPPAQVHLVLQGTDNAGSCWPGSHGWVTNHPWARQPATALPDETQKLLSYSSPCKSQVMFLQACGWLVLLSQNSSTAVPRSTKSPQRTHSPSASPRFSQRLGFTLWRFSSDQTFFTCSDHFSSSGTHTFMPLSN